MGRHPDPIERKRALARGDGKTPGGREIATTPYKIIEVADRPVMPRKLGRRGRLEWAKIWDAGPWLSTTQDYPWIEQICRAYDDIEVFRRKVDEDGLVQEGSLGQPVAHPLIAEIRKCELTIRQCLSIIGFSPSDRSRLGLAEVKRQQGLADLISRSAQS